MAIDSSTHSSLIQGISQQAVNSRGTASCEDQENCLNEVLDGAVSRMGTTVVVTQEGSTLNDPYVHEISRGPDEKYLVLIEGGSLEVWNRKTGRVYQTTNAYLQHGAVPARKAFQAVTVGDTTFILNRGKVVSMHSDKTPQRANWGCVYFRAGGYKVTYTLTIRVGTTNYTASYTTPDNSESGNAQYITTDHLAEQFRQSLVSSIFPSMVSDGHTGFSVVRYGSTLVIKCSVASTNFSIRTTDGVGDTHMKSFKNSVKSIADLPVKCEDGYEVMVRADGGADSESYFLKYEGDTDSGVWVEKVAPNTPYMLLDASMPHRLVNTDVNEFDFGSATWGRRIAGDGIYTSLDPSFVEMPIRSLQFLSGRLAAVCENTAILSRARNAYVFFPDTAQTVLDTAPIDYDVTNGNATLIEHAVVAGGKLQFWGDGQQTYLDSGQEALKEDTTEVLPLANYEYDGETAPKPVGLSSILFTTAVGNWSKITEMFHQRGVPSGEIAISDHVPRLVKGKVRHMGIGEASRKAIFLTDAEPNTAYIYQWYNQGQERVQSAWNRWTFPGPSKIIWAGVEGNQATFLFRWTNGGTSNLTLEVVQLDALGDEPDAKFPLRLDHRLSSESAQLVNGKWRLSLPFEVPVPKRELFVCYQNVDDFANDVRRGRKVPFRWISSSEIELLLENPHMSFYFGVIPVARRKDSRFFVRDEQEQPIIHDKLLLKSVVVSHDRTAEYDVLVHKRDGSVVRHTHSSRILGDQTVTNMDVPIKTGTFTATIGSEAEDAVIELRNATPFPCIWTSMKYIYDLIVRVA